MYARFCANACTLLLCLNFVVMQSDKDATVFAAGLAAIVQLSNVVGPELNVHLKALLPSVTSSFHIMSSFTISTIYIIYYFDVVMHCNTAKLRL